MAVCDPGARMAVNTLVNDRGWQVDPRFHRRKPAFCAAIVPKSAPSEPPLIYVNAAFCISRSFTENKAG